MNIYRNWLGIVCPHETYEDKVWPETQAGQNATSTTSCPQGQVGGYFRYCDTNSTWDSVVINSCCRFNIFLFILVTVCSADTLEGITYPETYANNSVTMPCPDGFTGSKTRTCSSEGTWQTPTGDCGLV